MDGLSIGALKDRLRETGLRATPARVAVLRCLLASRSPLTHGDVCEQIGEQGYNRATIYRNLSDLTEVGLAVRKDLGDHLWRFEAVRDDAHSKAMHPHFVCESCGTVSCLPEHAIDLREVSGVPRSVSARAVEIQVRGLCNTCD